MSGDTKKKALNGIFKKILSLQDILNHCAMMMKEHNYDLRNLSKKEDFIVKVKDLTEQCLGIIELKHLKSQKEHEYQENLLGLESQKEEISSKKEACDQKKDQSNEREELKNISDEEEVYLYESEPDEVPNESKKVKIKVSIGKKRESKIINDNRKSILNENTLNFKENPCNKDKGKILTWEIYCFRL